MLTTLVPLVAALAAPPPASSAPDAPDVGALIADRLERLEPFGYHGALVVARGGRVVVADARGDADRELGTSITRETIFDIGSLAKQFTAAAILRLEMDGRLSVDDPIERHLADVPEDKRGITIHQLLTHTAGLPYQPGPGRVLDLPLIAEPGGPWRYSNCGYMLLADVVDATAGEPFEIFLRRAVFDAAGLVHTGVRGRVDAPRALFARAYTDGTAQSSAAEAIDAPIARGAGGVVSCVDDLLRWEQALVDHRVLDADATRRFFAEHARNPSDTAGSAYGWVTVTTERGSRVILGQGNYGGFNTDFRRYPDEGTTIVFLSNHFVRGRSMRDAVVNDVSRLLHGDADTRAALPEPPRTTVLDDDLRPALPGRYALPDGATIDVAVDDAGRTVILGAVGASAIDLVFGAPTDGRAFADACATTAATIVEAAVRGDRAPFDENVSPALPGAWPGLASMIEDFRAEHGAIERVRPLGAAAGARPRDALAWVALDGADGGAAMAFVLSGGGIIHFEWTDAPATAPWRPTEPERLTRYDIFGGARRDALVERDADGAVTALRFDVGDDAVRAVRRVETRPGR